MSTQHYVVNGPAQAVQSPPFDFRGRPLQHEHSEYAESSTGGERTPAAADMHVASTGLADRDTIDQKQLEDKLLEIAPMTAHQKSLWWEEHERWMRTQEQWTRDMREQGKRQLQEWEGKRNEQIDSMQQKIQEIEKQLDKDPLRPKQRYQESPPEPDLRNVRHAKTVFTAMIEDFSPVWYTVAMSTGILGLVLAEFPYRFTGLSTAIADIFYVLDLVLVLVASTIQIARFVLYPKAAYMKTRGDPDELSLWGAFPIAILTLAALTATQISNAYWGGHWASILAVVLWWIGAVGIFFVSVFVTDSLARNGIIHDRTFSATLMIPAVGVATAAAEAGFIANYAYDLSARVAVPMIIVGYFMAGLGLFLSLTFYAMFTHRLFSAGWPEPTKVPGMFMLCGPMGQTATALQSLSSAAYTRADFAHYNKGTFLTATASSGLSSASILLALLCLGFVYFWAFVVLTALIENAIKKKLSYSMMWWATIFPLGTVCTAWLELSIEMNSPTFRTLVTGLWLILFVDFLVNWIFTLKGVFFGNLLFKRSKEDMQKQIEDEEKSA